MKLKQLDISILQTQFKNLNIQTTPTQESFDEITKTFLGDSYTEVLFTSKRSKESNNNGFYSLFITETMIRFIQVTSLKKIDFRLYFNPYKLLLNNNKVDSSFLISFQEKISKVESNYFDGLVSILGTPKNI